MKLCKDCKFCSYKEPNWLGRLFPILVSTDDKLEFSKCLNEIALTGDVKDYQLYISGIAKPPNKKDYSYCGTMRTLEKYCGPEGKHWEPKR